MCSTSFAAAAAHLSMWSWVPLLLLLLPAPPQAQPLLLQDHQSDPPQPWGTLWDAPAQHGTAGRMPEVKRHASKFTRHGDCEAMQRGHVNFNTLSHSTPAQTQTDWLIVGDAAQDETRCVCTAVIGIRQHTTTQHSLHPSSVLQGPSCQLHEARCACIHTHSP